VIAEPILTDFAYLAERMRPDEIDQLLAFTGWAEYVPDRAARLWAATPGECVALLGPDGRALGLGGLTPVSPGVYEAWSVSTLAAWDTHWRAITKLCRRQIDHALANGAHRVQVCSLASRTRAGEWYVRGLGLKREGCLRRYTADGRDAVMYARVKA
jgi:hypothetical protein